jgi:uncharacterized protein with HEPN domain
MAQERAPLALYHMLDAIEHFLSIVGTANASQLGADQTRRYAVERCVEIISESSRRIPSDWKIEHPSIPWSDIAGIGSVLRHNYEDVNLDIIVKLRGPSLENLKRVALALLEKYDPDGRRFRNR